MKIYPDMRAAQDAVKDHFNDSKDLKLAKWKEIPIGDDGLDVLMKFEGPHNRDGWVEIDYDSGDIYVGHNVHGKAEEKWVATAYSGNETETRRKIESALNSLGV